MRDGVRMVVKRQHPQLFNVICDMYWHVELTLVSLDGCSRLSAGKGTTSVNKLVCLTDVGCRYPSVVPWTTNGTVSGFLCLER